MKICYDTSSILFLLNVLAVAGFVLMCLYKFIEVLRSLLRHSRNLKEMKKRVAHEKNKPEIKPSNDVVVADNSLKDFGVKTPPKSHSLPKDSAVEPLRQFDYESLKYATHNFSLPVRMSADGLGDVFRANMVSTNEVFAIRRLKPLCFLTIQEFYRELSVLGQVNHPNVAKLIGYSIHRQGCWALVYEYSHGGGSLEDYLHGNKPCLDWKKRMKIVQGIAKALQYLHNVTNPPILHCYIEPANIWLDEDFTPKLSAAGVVRMFPTPDRSGFPLDTIGSYVYSASDYRLTGTVNVVSDIYGFGILLLEVISSKKGIFLGGDGNRHMLNDWIKPYFEDGYLAKIVDPRLEGKIEEYELHEACAIAAACLDEQPSNRPLIADLVICMDYLAGYHDS